MGASMVLTMQKARKGKGVKKETCPDCWGALTLKGREAWCDTCGFSTEDLKAWKEENMGRDPSPIKYGVKSRDGFTLSSRWKETPIDFLLRVHDKYGVTWDRLEWLNKRLLKRSDLFVVAAFAGVCLVAEKDKDGDVVEYYRCYDPRDGWDNEPPAWAK